MQFAVNVLSRIKTDSESVVSQLTDMFNVRQKNQSDSILKFCYLLHIFVMIAKLFLREKILNLVKEEDDCIFLYHAVPVLDWHFLFT